MASVPESTEPPPTDSAHHKSSSPDLFSSAKVLAGAARSAFSHGGAAVDKAKVAEAGEDLLDAGSEYGKLREKGYGNYVDKAEGYLHQFHSSDQKPAHSSPPQEAESTPEVKSTAPPEGAAPEEHKSGGGGFGGFGDYIDIAQGFLKK